MLSLRGSPEMSEKPQAGKAGSLTTEQLRSWHDNGYLLIPDALSQAEITTPTAGAEGAAKALLQRGSEVKEHASTNTEGARGSTSHRVIASWLP